jgi:hypothetical protein
MNEDDQRRATEFLTELYAAGGIDTGRFNTGVAGLLAATTETELADVVRSLPPPVALTSPDRRLTKPLEIHSGMRRLRLTGRWQVARETHVSADLGSVRIDLTEAEFDDRVIDLHVYTGWGSITIIVPRGVGVQVIHHRGGIDSRLEPPLPGLRGAGRLSHRRAGTRPSRGLERSSAAGAGTSLSHRGGGTRPPSGGPGADARHRPRCRSGPAPGRSPRRPRPQRG